MKKSIIKTVVLAALMAGRIPTVHRISVSRDDKCKE